MESLYGVSVTNKYELFLNEDEDPLDFLKAHEAREAKRKKNKFSGKENICSTEKIEGKKQVKDTRSAKVLKPSQKSKPIEESVSEVPKGRSVKFLGGGESEERSKNVPQELEDYVKDSSFESGDPQRYARRGQPSVRGRGRGSRGPLEYRPRREFDRHSGSDKSGVKPVDKREGRGARNWGNYRDDPQDEFQQQTREEEEEVWDVEEEVKPAPVQPPAEETPSEQQTEQTQGNEDDSAPIPSSPPPSPSREDEEDESRQLTLDEWRSLHGNRQKPTFNIRRPGEGEEPGRWKKMYVLKKKIEDGSDEDDDEQEYEFYPQRAGRQKQVLDIDIRFADSPARMSRGRGRGPRGSRVFGPSRGRRGRGGRRQDNTDDEKIIKVYDEADFPSLS